MAEVCQWPKKPGESTFPPHALSACPLCKNENILRDALLSHVLDTHSRSRISSSELLPSLLSVTDSDSALFLANLLIYIFSTLYTMYAPRAYYYSSARNNCARYKQMRKMRVAALIFLCRTNFNQEVSRLISPIMVQASCAMALQRVWLCTILCPWKYIITLVLQMGSSK